MASDTSCKTRQERVKGQQTLHAGTKSVFPDLEGSMLTNGQSPYLLPNLAGDAAVSPANPLTSEAAGGSKAPGPSAWIRDSDRTIEPLPGQHLGLAKPRGLCTGANSVDEMRGSRRDTLDKRKRKAGLVRGPGQGKGIQPGADQSGSQASLKLPIGPQEALQYSLDLRKTLGKIRVLGKLFGTGNLLLHILQRIASNQGVETEAAVDV